MDAQEFQDPKKVSAIWVKNLESSMFDMKPKNAINLILLSLISLKHIQKKTCYLKIVYTGIHIDPTNNVKTKREAQRPKDFIWSKNTYWLD